MENSEFPPNSEVSKRQQDKDVQQITSGGVVRKKKSLRKQFKEMFVVGDAKSAIQYVVMDVLLPAAKDTVIDMQDAWLRRLFYGDSYRRRGSTTPQSGPLGHVAYNRISSMGRGTMAPQRAMSSQARSQFDFDEIVLDSRVEAEEVIDRLFDLVSRYESATVADLYELVGLAATHTDHKWGWTDIRGAGVSRIRDGYLLDLPDPDPIT